MVSKQYISFLNSIVELFHDTFIYQKEGEYIFCHTDLNWTFQNRKIKHFVTWNWKFIVQSELCCPWEVVDEEEQQKSFYQGVHIIIVYICPTFAICSEK